MARQILAQARFNTTSARKLYTAKTGKPAINCTLVISDVQTGGADVSVFLVENADLDVAPDQGNAILYTVAEVANSINPISPEGWLVVPSGWTMYVQSDTANEFTYTLFGDV